MERNRCWRRKKNFSKGRRKKNIAMALYQGGWYEHDGQYIKGKIHCSCPMCRRKTNTHYGISTNWKHTDALKVLSMNSQEKDFTENKAC